MPPAALIPVTADDIDPSAYAALRPACLKHGFLPVFLDGMLLVAAVKDPGNEAVASEIRGLTHQEVRRFGISSADFDLAVSELESRGSRSTNTLKAGETRGIAACPESWEAHRRSPRDVAADMARHAFFSGASDLLLDEQESWMDVAVKIAGQKEILPPVEKGWAAPVIRAFKEMAGMPAGAAQTWHSGAASLPSGDGRRVEMRIEAAPTVHGETLVARIQDRTLQLARMERLPFSDPAQAALAEKCLVQSQGLFISTGPTGHGKTTTLYACLGRLDRSTMNIRTLEDPVEFAVPWITQIPVGCGTGRGFGGGLKSLLRQAPHAILMGEIRDSEVARTCLEAVVTGHLIFATMHTRDAIGAVPRLLDLGATGRQIAEALLLAVGQRLARQLCPHCRIETAVNTRQAVHFERYRLEAPARLFRPGGCPRCAGRGELGVRAIFELFDPAADENIRDLIACSDSSSLRESLLRNRWIAAGGSCLVREGLKAAASGEIAYPEVLKFERTPP